MKKLLVRQSSDAWIARTGGTSIAHLKDVEHGCSPRGSLPYLILALTLVSGLLSSRTTLAGTTIDYVAPAEIQSVISESKLAVQPLKPELLSGTNWRCELLGAQSHLQRQSFARYYEFSADGLTLHNSGSHVIKSFAVQNGRLFGETPELVEEIQLTALDRRMLTIIRSKAHPDQVLAVGHCAQNENATLPK